MPGPAVRRSALTRRVIAIVLGMIAVGCSSRASTHGTDGTTIAPVVMPSSPYQPFTSSYAAQRHTFEAYVSCAASHGVDFEGPLTDSTGNSLFFRLTPSEKATVAEQQAVNRDCPQGTVGLFGTPIDGLHRATFEHAATAFARCLRSHGERSFPSPTFARSDPVATFWTLPFDWLSELFTTAARACVGPLREYLFAS